jgi:adenylate kinase family enzyme
MIFGRPGGGKSTFAVWLSDALQLPLHHLDKHFFTANWIERDYNEFLSIQKNIVTGKTWIIDGNSIHSLETRWSHADLVLYFNYPKWICYWRILKRFLYPNCNIRPLSKLALVRQVQGTYGAQKRSVHGVHEHSSTGVTQQLPTGVEFRKRSIDDRAPDCHEAIRIPLLKYVWNFNKRVEPIISLLKHKYPNAVFKEIKNGKDLEELKHELTILNQVTYKPGSVQGTTPHG